MNNSGMDFNQNISIFDPNRLRVAKGRNRKRVIKTIIGLLIASLTICFWVWPKMIKPLIPENDLYTPEVVNVFSCTQQISNGKKCYSSITVADCTADGQITGYVEFLIRRNFEDDIYGKYNIRGQIRDKKKNSNLIIDTEFVKWTIEPQVNYSFLIGETFRVKKGCTILEDTLTGTKYTTEYDDYIPVYSADDLLKMNGSSQTFMLQNDIDMEGIEWSPICDFDGILIGRGYKIKNMSIQGNGDNIGFFAVLEGQVVNLEFENASVRVDKYCENIGIVCGKLLNGVLNQIKVSGIVNAPKAEHVGGMVGYAEYSGTKSVNLLESNVQVVGRNYVGGVYGYVNNYVSNGIHFYTLLLSEVRNHSAVTATEDYVGGILGYMSSEASGYGGTAYVNLNECRNFGMITGRYYVGGIAGFVEGDPYGTKYSEIVRCTNQSVIYGDAYVGCIAGYIDQCVVRNSSNDGSTLDVQSQMITDGEKIACIGGLVGYGLCANDCVNYIDVNYYGQGAYVGGLMGCCKWIGTGTMSTLVNLGNVSGYNYVGGIVGFLQDYISNGIHDYTFTMENLTNKGDVSGMYSFTGGIIGYCSGEADSAFGSMKFFVYDCINSGNIQGDECVGSLIGCFDYLHSRSTSIKIENCYSYTQFDEPCQDGLVGKHINKGNER